MIRTSRRLATTSRFGIRWFVLAIALACLTPVILANSNDPLRYHSGVRNSPTRGLGKKQQQAVLRSLRQKTGWKTLDFDSDGFLQIDDETSFEGGSATARELLSAVLAGDDAYDLEEHDRSRTVAFARLGSPVSYQSLKSRNQIEVLPVEIDFMDFDRLRGEGAVLASFDLGMVLLHEFAHGILGLRDVSNNDEGLGECETHINKIRRELRLPERQNYMARLTDRQSNLSGAVRPHAELVFARNTSTDNSRSRGKRETFTLFWEAEMVGQIRTDTSFSRNRSGTMAMQ
jgi:hypothetical protein